MEKDLSLIEQQTCRFGQREGSPQAWSWPDLPGTLGPDLGGLFPSEGDKDKETDRMGSGPETPSDEELPQGCLGTWESHTLAVASVCPPLLSFLLLLN